MAEPQKAPDDNGDKDDVLIAKHFDDYCTAIDRAREAAKTTCTAAWMSNYEANTKRHRAAVAESTRRIGAVVERIGAFDTDEDSEKALRDEVKLLAEERIAYATWRERAVSPYKTSVDECHKIRNGAINEAQNAEASSPLVHHGLSARIQKVIDKWPLATWDEGSGTVTVTD